MSSTNAWQRSEVILCLCLHLSMANILKQHADATFFPNIRELLKILSVIPVGIVESERYFSCVRRIRNWLRSTMTTDRLGDLAVIAMYGHSIPISRTDIYIVVKNVVPYFENSHLPLENPGSATDLMFKLDSLHLVNEVSRLRSQSGVHRGRGPSNC